MRLALTIDSASEKELRSFILAHREATGYTIASDPEGRDGVTVMLNGPECYSATTPRMKEGEALMMAASFDDKIRALRAAELRGACG